MKCSTAAINAAACSGEAEGAIKRGCERPSSILAL
jgi:hypothetical protein